MKFLKGIVYALGGLIVIALAGVAFVWFAGGRAANAASGATSALVLDTAHADRARGEHLFDVISGCADCHRASGGGAVFIKDPGFGLLSAPNLTSGKGGIGTRYTDADYERAIRRGLRPDGSRLLIMPSEGYAALSNADVASVIAYVRSLPPVANAPGRRLGLVPRLLALMGKAPFAADQIDQNATHPATVVPVADAGYGRYLAHIAGCIDCHGQGFSGGHLAGSPSDPPAQNITPTGIGNWTYADFAHALRTGYRPDHTVIEPFMPWRTYARMTDDELQALYQFLKTVPPRPSGNG